MGKNRNVVTLVKTGKEITLSPAKGYPVNEGISQVEIPILHAETCETVETVEEVSPVVGIVETRFPQGIGFIIPTTPAAVSPAAVNQTKGGWRFDTLPLASEEFPPTGILSAIPRDSANNKVDTAGYACYATMRKHKGRFLTVNEWETLIKSTYRIKAVGNFSGGVRDWLVWMVFKKPLCGVIRREDNTYGIPAAK